MRWLDSLETTHVRIIDVPRFVEYDDVWSEVTRILGSFTPDEDANSIARQRTVFELVQLVINTSLSLSGKASSNVEDLDNDPGDCINSLFRMLKLEDSWYDEDSRAPNETSILKAIEILHRTPGLTDLISTGPLYEGGVILEYEANDWSYSLEVPNSGKIEFYGVEITGDDETDTHRFKKVNEDLLHRIDMSIR